MEAHDTPFTVVDLTVPDYTEAQRKYARAALLMWQAGPVNPLGVSRTLNEAITAEFKATGQMDDVGPAALLINWSLQHIISGRYHTFDVDISVLVDALAECRKRVAGTTFDVEG